MNSRAQLRIVFHGAIALFVGLLCGFPTILEMTGEQLRLWRSAHVGLITTGIWLLATAAVLPLLDLKSREVSGLVWSLVATAYGFMTALLIEAMTGARAIQSNGSVATFVALTANSIGVVAALLAVVLTLTGARAALKRYPTHAETDRNGGSDA